jgi:membrane-associated phospholipid phosphatase
MYSIIKGSKWFYIPYLIIFICCIAVIFIYTKAEIHIYLNKFHTPFFDNFFKLVTNLGDGIVLPLFLLIIVFIRFRYALLFLMVFLLSGLIVQLLKRTIFDDIVRPAEFFKGIYELYLVPGIKQYYQNSFPSGHSATAFGYMICFAYIFTNKWIKIFLLLVACTIAYSRVYLSQHFLIDIAVGSFIGVLSATVLSYYVQLFKAKWLEMNLNTILSRKVKNI